MPLLTKEQVLAADDRKIEIVPVPEWGGDVAVRSLTEQEYDDFQDGLYKRMPGKGKGLEFDRRVVRLRLAAATIVDQAGKPMFDEADLAGKSSAALSRIVEVAMRLVGMSDDDAEDLAKNSGTGPDAGSSSSSPSPSAEPTSTS